MSALPSDDHPGGGPYRAAFDAPGRPTAPPAIACEGVSVSFRGKSVLRDVRFEVARGSVYGFIGPNGAGKTTTLRVLATLLEPTSGTARVAGHDVLSHPAEVRRVVGYMPDGHGVHERVSVREYLDFFASAHGIHGAERERVVGRAMALTEAGPLRSAHLTTLSKGQKQRVLLARTLLHDPEVLLLDEPASDLDPRARVELRELLAQLARMGKTVLLRGPSWVDGLCPLWVAAQAGLRAREVLAAGLAGWPLAAVASVAGLFGIARASAAR